MKLWQQKNDTLNKRIEAFTVGLDPVLDQQLVKYDCTASMAHVRMLGKMGVLSETQQKCLLDELEHIIELDRQGEFEISPADEDCHTAIENHLVKVCGSAGKSVHTFRSRNDQVLTALRLLYKNRLRMILEQLSHLHRTLAVFVRKNGSAPLPGFSHTRKAMPSSVRLWAKGIQEAFQDDRRLLKGVHALIDQSPLGTGSGYGLPCRIDRAFTQKLLGFRKLQKNPIYTQNSRGKFEAIILNALTAILYDVNRLSADLILFTLPEFDFFRLPECFLTGSSMMPHKRNPDFLEILRGSYHQVLAYESEVKQMTANLISGYHRDLQLTKEPVLKGFERTIHALEIVDLLFKDLKPKPSSCRRAMTRELYATNDVYELVKQGVPFREAYQVVAEDYVNSEKSPSSP